MWGTLCNFLFRKLSSRPEARSPPSRCDSAIAPAYGKRLKLSHPDADSSGMFGEARSAGDCLMQPQENIVISDDEDDECYVVAEIPRKQHLRSSTVIKRASISVIKRAARSSPSASTRTARPSSSVTSRVARQSSSITIRAAGPSSTVTIGAAGPSSTLTRAAGPSSTVTIRTAGPSSTVTRAAGPSLTVTARVAGPSFTATTRAAGPSSTVTRAAGPSSTVTAGPSLTVTARVAGPSFTATTRAAGPSSTVTTRAAGPSSTVIKSLHDIVQEGNATVGDPFSPSSFQSQTFQRKDDHEDVEVVKYGSTSRRDQSAKTPDKGYKNKFFNSQRTSFIQRGQAMSKIKFNAVLRQRIDSFQETYRLQEKQEYMQLLQSQVSVNLLQVNSSHTVGHTKRFESSGVPVIDLTEGTSGDDDLDVQFIQEIPAVQTFQDVIKNKPVATEENPPEVVISPQPESQPEPPEDIPCEVNVIDVRQNPIIIVDDEDEDDDDHDDDDNDNDDENDENVLPENLADKLAKLMRLTNLQQVKDFMMKVHFPPLTPAQEEKVDNVLNYNNAHDVVAERFGLKITKRDMHTLFNINWLNDEIINFYMQLIMERSNRNRTLPRVYAFNTFFYPKLMTGDYQSLKRWTRKVDIFTFDILLVPIHLKWHWCLAVIDLRSKSIKYYNSIRSANQQCLNSLYAYLEAEKRYKRSERLDESEWVKYQVPDIPQQMNGSDCGVFACVYAEYIARDTPMGFTQKEMPYFRKKIAIEILEEKLLT